jgi:hypothetical protein
MVWSREHRDYLKFNEEEAFLAIYRVGDNDFNSPDHHGTKSERLRAYLAGFESKANSIDDAFTLGERYVRQMDSE